MDLSDENEIRSLVADLEPRDDLDIYRFRPPGPVAQSFLNNHAVLTKGIMGPVGGGKTTTCAFGRILAATLMPPGRDTVRRCRWIVLRTSFRDAERTVLASWKLWFPKTYAGSTWTGGNDRPVVHTLRFRLLDGTIAEAETHFIGLGEHRVSDVLRGLEISGAWLNEADMLSPDALSAVEQRVGRYPPRTLLADPDASVHRQVIFDLNAPDMDNWVHGTFVENATPERRLYSQPGGLEAGAENLRNLPKDYYEKMAATQEAWFVRRFVDNRFGYSRDGKPVYEAFSESLHVAPRPIDPDPGLLTLIGLDAGLHPAAVIAQAAPSGQLRITDEVYLGHGYGVDRFGEAVLDVLARRGYPPLSGATARAWADPAAQYGADRQGGELAWVESMSRVLGLAIGVPVSNELSLRIGAVSLELRTMLDHGQPRLLVSPHCKQFIRGMSSRYRYKKRTDGSYDPVPDKGDASHLQDAGQYLVLGYRGAAGVVAEAGRGGRVGGGGSSSAGRRQAAGSFDPHQVGVTRNIS